MTEQEAAAKYREWLHGNTPHFCQVDRLARALWIMEGGVATNDWGEHITGYRARAKRILTTPDGWENP